MKIVLLLLALFAAFGFAFKKTIDSRVLLAERPAAAHVALTEKAVVEPQAVALL